MAQARKVRRKPASTRSRRPIPGWFWLLAGMLAGLAVAAVLYLQGADRMGQDPGWLTHGESPPPPIAPLRDPPAATPDAPAERSRFQFYELLPQDEVRIPESAPAAPPPPRAAPAPVPQPQARPDTGSRVLLQTGSFRQFQQADEMKARLALMGLTANIREVRIDGQTFHRVFVGPFDSDAQVARALERLRSENIEALRLPAS
ncbi:MAG: SPOR domain-containing protein [Thioalkalivibrio sp.]|nr:SPOR domain-containing protein [Thioalkalivibrio sp.]